MNISTVKQNNNTQGERIDLVELKRKTINLFVFGHGNVGGLLIDQILEAQQQLGEQRDLDLRVVAIANSSSWIFSSNGIQGDWRKQKKEQAKGYSMKDVLQKVEAFGLYNLVAIDNTASPSFVLNYLPLVTGGFNLVSSNKIANTLTIDFYKKLRQILTQKRKSYLYETNVGAGLPLIDTIKLLHQSGENITRINGIFSGSLSYVFNNFSESSSSFQSVLEEAVILGLTEPDPREDLSGNDVGRKLLILARELDLHNEFEDVKIQNLIPKELQAITPDKFLLSLSQLNPVFSVIKERQKPDHVLRYVGSLTGNLFDSKGAKLEVSLVSVAKNSMLGQVSGSDSMFEIFTQSYGDRPIVIQGAGAGAAVTARGVFGDVLRIAAQVQA